MSTISFPGLGIDNFTLNRVAFSIGKLDVYWYALFITLGMILAVAYCYYRSRFEGVNFDHIIDMALFAIPLGVVGARIYYVLFSLSDTKYESFKDVINIREGGLAIYGGIIAGALTIFFVCRFKKIKPLKVFDMVAPAAMIGQILGRWGNFFNGEAYGAEVTEGGLLYFIRMGLISSNTRHDFGTSQMVYVHPTFLYESLWNLLGFIIINIFYKKKKFDGQILFMYIGVFRVSQVVAFVCFVVGAILLIYNLAKAYRVRQTAKDYDPAYPKFSHTTTSQIAQAAEQDTGEAEGDEREEKYTEEASDGDGESGEDSGGEEDDFKHYRIKRSESGENVDESLKNLFSSEDTDGNTESNENK